MYSFSALSGGKRLRPFLVYAIGDMLQVNPVSFECIHTYSLIHDDLPSMDNDILRRNKPTCHIKFGQYVAILAPLIF